MFLLSSYNPEGPAVAEPAIFSTDPIPENAEFPFIIISGPVSDEHFDQKGSIGGREALVDIRVYDDRKGSVLRVTSIAERVRFLLHRQTIAISGLTYVDSRVSGPIVNDENEVYSRLLTLRLLYAA